ncbi:MAG: tetratricopeptide repeat protein [Bacteroidaceae bacterium]|nr:tetratricopeptide repeat protein [Bacteroidaceae bacterium]
MHCDDDLKYFEDPEFKEILEKYEAAKELGMSVYMDADELTDVAEYYSMVCHDDESADEVIDLALQLHPDAVDPQIFRARKFMRDGDINKARQLCDLIDDQKNREVIFLRAELLLQEQKNEQALQYLLLVADSVEEDQDFFFYDSAYIFIDYQDYTSAKCLADKLEEMAPKWFKTWEVMADIHLGLDHFQEALPYINRMLDVDPFYVDAWNWSCEAYTGLNQYGKAIESADYALAIEPQNERALQLKAWCLLQQENYEQAHELYQQLQRMNPEYEPHVFHDSFCLFDLGDLQGALQLVEKAEQLAEENCPDLPSIYEHHAHILSELHDVQGALAQIDRAEKAFNMSGLEPAEQPDFDYFRARIYANNDQVEEAERFITIIGDKKREPLEKVLFQMAQILFDAHSVKALKYFEILMQKLDQRLLLQSAYFTDVQEQRACFNDLKVQAYPYMALLYHETEQPDKCLEFIRLCIYWQSPETEDILGFLFPEGTHPSDYYDYYYYMLHGSWPDEPAILPF